MKITTFHPSHFSAIRPHHKLDAMVARVTPEYLAAIAAETSFTLWIGGRPMACAGVMGECELWALIDAEIRWHRFALFRASRRFLSTFGWLYSNVPTDFWPGCNWLEHLGFHRKRIVTLPTGQHWRYERVMS